ncbi:MAG: carboxypeptidase regulatory-like domain-containing protein [Candidatus Aminicenantes bacterium]|nr:MAG: carboxypeptidase regulatory-like domain-containing protein [Candidatus Aminicenantes bacterium]
MRINSVVGLLSLVMISLFCLYGMGTGAVNASHGIYMKVSGKVIQKETGQGIPGIQILLYEITSGENYFANTNNEGIFIVRKVPPGIYQISETFVNMSCPEELIVAEMPEMIKVSTGRNVINLKISLEKGAAISGYVYAADGVTPLKDVEITAEPWIYGRGKPVFTDSQGKYILKGLVDGDKLVHALFQGLAHESIDLEIKPGEDIGNINFILGRGNISVKGKVVSFIDNQPVKNAFVSFIYQYPNQKYSAGWAKTDDSGNYSLIGLKHPGTFELSIAHDEYDEPDSFISLSYGENIINLELTVKRELALTHFEGKKNDNQRKSNARGCCDEYEHKYVEIQNELCKLLESKEVQYCIGDKYVLDCLEYRCFERNYFIICYNKCNPGESGRTSTIYLNIKKYNYGYMWLCTNNKVHTIDEIKEFIFHELFHMCDRGGRRSRTFCAEWRAYRSTYCIFRNPSSKKHKMLYKRKCYECLLKGKDCNPKNNEGKR